MLLFHAGQDLQRYLGPAGVGAINASCWSFLTSSATQGKARDIFPGKAKRDGLIGIRCLEMFSERNAPGKIHGFVGRGWYSHRTCCKFFLLYLVGTFSFSSSFLSPATGIVLLFCMPVLYPPLVFCHYFWSKGDR